MAPELIDGKSASSQSDQWALAVTAYLLLTGSKPFVGQNDGHLVQLILAASPEPPSRLRPTLPPALDDVFVRAFNRNPLQRYPSCRSFATALASSLKVLALLRQKLSLQNLKRRSRHRPSLGTHNQARDGLSPLGCLRSFLPAWSRGGNGRSIHRLRRSQSSVSQQSRKQ